MTTKLYYHLDVKGFAFVKPIIPNVEDVCGICGKTRVVKRRIENLSSIALSTSNGMVT